MKVLKLLLIFYLVLCSENISCQVDLSMASESPELVAEGIISTALYERDFAISPDGNEIIYTLGNYKQTRRCLVHLKKVGNRWGDPQVLSISGRYQDIEPFFSPDGKRLFFASNRPMSADDKSTDYNIWFAIKQGDEWGAAQSLDTIINTSGDEFYPSVTANGNLYFTATKNNGIGREDIFISKYENGKYMLPSVLDSNINTLVYEFNAYVSPEENLIIFSSFGRNDSHGGGDLYYSKKKTNGKWQKSQNMGPSVNSDKLDFCPFVDQRHMILYFTSEKQKSNNSEISTIEELKVIANSVENGMGNIYKVKFSDLNY